MRWVTSIPLGWCSWTRWAPTPRWLHFTPTLPWANERHRYFEIPRNRGTNTTLLASLHSEGMGPSMAVEGATTVRVFEAYVERVLAPSLRPGQVVVMDRLG